MIDRVMVKWPVFRSCRSDLVLRAEIKSRFAPAKFKNKMHRRVLILTF